MSGYIISVRGIIDKQNINKLNIKCFVTVHEIENYVIGILYTSPCGNKSKVSTSESLQFSGWVSVCRSFTVSTSNLGSTDYVFGRVEATETDGTDAFRTWRRFYGVVNKECFVKA